MWWEIFVYGFRRYGPDSFEAKMNENEYISLVRLLKNNRGDEIVFTLLKEIKWGGWRTEPTGVQYKPEFVWLRRYVDMRHGTVTIILAARGVETITKKVFAHPDVDQLRMWGEPCR